MSQLDSAVRINSPWFSCRYSDDQPPHTPIVKLRQGVTGAAFTTEWEPGIGVGADITAVWIKSQTMVRFPYP